MVSKDVPDIWFRFAGYPAIFHYPVPVPAKILTGAGECNQIIYKSQQ